MPVAEFHRLYSFMDDLVTDGGKYVSVACMVQFSWNAFVEEKLQPMEHVSKGGIDWQSFGQSTEADGQCKKYRLLLKWIHRIEDKKHRHYLRRHI